MAATPATRVFPGGHGQVALNSGVLSTSEPSARGFVATAGKGHLPPRHTLPAPRNLALSPTLPDSTVPCWPLILRGWHGLQALCFLSQNPKGGFDFQRFPLGSRCRKSFWARESWPGGELLHVARSQATKTTTARHLRSSGPPILRHTQYGYVKIGKRPPPPPSEKSFQLSKQSHTHGMFCSQDRDISASFASRPGGSPESGFRDPFWGHFALVIPLKP